MYTRLEDSAEPRKGMESMGESRSRMAVAYSMSHEKCAGERPDDSSSSRE